MSRCSMQKARVGLYVQLVHCTCLIQSFSRVVSRFEMLAKALPSSSNQTYKYKIKGITIATSLVILKFHSKSNFHTHILELGQYSIHNIRQIISTEMMGCVSISLPFYFRRKGMKSTIEITCVTNRCMQVSIHLWCHLIADSAGKSSKYRYRTPIKFMPITIVQIDDNNCDLTAFFIMTRL